MSPEWQRKLNLPQELLGKEAWSTAEGTSTCFLAEDTEKSLLGQ